ncbi:homoserine kinase (plasmid) [Fulvitalea axinellae]|uniref:Homoserine kinase n=1 Tax=Fulvitalea axinellae TaxID=1182444 RepID=A0AAU9CT13_9BACT|nr:homoserine kinase [Fulvitalea axinellae]
MADLDFERLLKSYDLGVFINAKRLSSGFANENYRLETDKGVFLARLCKQQPLENIEYELWVLKGLKSLDFPAAYPIARKDGSLISDSSAGYFVFYDFISGSEPEANIETAKEIGNASAKIGLFPNPEEKIKQNYLDWECCEQVLARIPESKNPKPDIFDFYIEQTEKLREAYHADLPKGLVHGDIFTDNTLFNGNKLSAIIDFEEACYENLLFEVGVAINGFCFKENRLSSELLDSYLNEYQKIRPLSSEELKWLPDYIKRGAHAMLTWHLQNDLVDVPNERQESRVRELCDRINLLESDLQEIIL